MDDSRSSGTHHEAREATGEITPANLLHSSSGEEPQVDTLQRARSHNGEPELSGGYPDPLGQLAGGPIFVTGHPRSGTTWMFDILTSHPAVAGVLESWVFGSLGGLTGLLRHGRGEREDIAQWAVGRSLGVTQLVGYEELVAELRSLSGRLLARSLAPEHRFLIEKSAAPELDVEATAEVFPDARFIHVIRDGRNVAVSARAAARAFRTPSWAPLARDGRLGRFRGLYAFGRRWPELVDYVRDAGQRLGDRYLEITYEELSAARQDSIWRVFEFCGIPCDEGVVLEAERSTDFDRNYRGGEDQFRRRGGVGGWHSRFGILDGLAYELGSKGRLKREGYVRHNAWWATGALGPAGDWPEG